MSERSASLLAEALKLPAKEQGELIDGLLDALGGAASDADDLTDDELAAELDRRAEEMRKILQPAWSGKTFNTCDERAWQSSFTASQSRNLSRHVGDTCNTAR